MHATPGTTFVTDASNCEFLERYAAPGRIGLCGGTTIVDKAICRAERHLDDQGQWSCWSHAFLFQGKRQDGQHWVIESDLQVHRKHIQLGVQENRITKYHDEKLYSVLGVLDLGLAEGQVSELIRTGLDLVADRTRYSLRELVGTLIALKRTNLRARENLFARESSMFCSALVHHLFRKTGIDLAPGLELKHTTPEDIARTRLPHTSWILKREAAQSKLHGLKSRLKARARLHRMRHPRSDGD